MTTRIVCAYVNALYASTFFPLIFIFSGVNTTSTDIFYQSLVNTMAVLNSKFLKINIFCACNNLYPKVVGNF